MNVVAHASSSDFSDSAKGNIYNGSFNYIWSERLSNEEEKRSAYPFT